MRKCAYVYYASYACALFSFRCALAFFARFCSDFWIVCCSFFSASICNVSVCVCVMCIFRSETALSSHPSPIRSISRLHTSSSLAVNITEICALHSETLFWCKRSQPSEIVCVCVCVGVCGFRMSAHFILCTPCIYRLSLVLQLHLCYMRVWVLVCMHVCMDACQWTHYQDKRY